MSVIRDHKTLSCHALLFLLSECGEDSRMLWSFHLEFLLFGRRSLHRDLMFRHGDSDDGGDSEVNWWVGEWCYVPTGDSSGIGSRGLSL